MIDCTPSSIIEASKCYCGLTAIQNSSVDIYLLCQWANNSSEALFEYDPPSALMTWIDPAHLGGSTTDLATFYATADVPNVTSVQWLTQPLTSISRLDLLPSLASVILGFNTTLHTLDLTNCVSLTTLACDGGDLFTLNITGCTSLQTMNCSLNPNLTSIIGLLDCTSLTIIDCGGCNLTSLDVAGLVNLTNLGCYSNPSLTTLTLTGCTALATLDCSNCDITGILNLTGLANMTTLVCRNNANMTGITLTGCATLDSADISACGLTSIDVTTCVSLTLLDISSNNLTGSSAFDLSNCVLLDAFYCGFNPLLTKVDMNGISASTLSAANCSISYVEMGASSHWVAVYLQNNAIPTGPGLGSVDQCLFDLRVNNLANAGICDLTGGTNGAPTSSCATPGSDCFLLNAAGWTVTTN